jgi:pilus assembly protein CpaB
MAGLIRRRRVIGVLCIVFAIGLMLAMAPLRRESASGTAYFAERAIPSGTPITGDMLTSRKIAGDFSPETANAESEIVGKYAAVNIVAGDVILRNKLTAAPPGDYRGVLTGEKVAISVNIKDFAYGLSGRLEAGDIVSVFASYDGYGTGGGDADGSSQGAGYKGRVVAPPELKYLSVLAVTDGDGMEKAERERAAQEEDDKTGDAEWSAATLTFLANPAQAELLAELEANGSMQFALVYHGDRAVADEFLAKQEEYLAKQEKTPAKQEETPAKQEETPTEGVDDDARGA